MIIRTKILATVGPACGDVDTLHRMAEAGCDLFRVNFSHGDEAQRDRFLRNIREVSRRMNRAFGAVADLCGPKIRVGLIEGGSMLLGEGQSLVIQREPVEGRPGRISTTLAELVDEADPGDRLLLDDGKLALRVMKRCNDDELVCEVTRGGVLSSGKGMNLPDTELTLSALTEKDRRDVDFIARRDFDYVALSFVRSAEDVHELQKLLRERDCWAHVIAKIEKPQAVKRIEEIVASVDVVMVARGDLGVEMDLPTVPVAQKRIARMCQSAGKPCIIATQMLESMTRAATPTRAEVSDVANAVLDHADAVMLSGETAVGDNPVAAVDMMNRVVEAVQDYYDEIACPQAVLHPTSQTTAALAEAVRQVLASEPIAAVAVFTASGMTSRLLAKSRLTRPILGISNDEAVVRRMSLYYGVTAVRADAPEHTRDVLAMASRFCIQRGLASKGERIVVLSGRPIGERGSTNTLVIHEVG